MNCGWGAQPALVFAFVYVSVMMLSLLLGEDERNPLRSMPSLPLPLLVIMLLALGTGLSSLVLTPPPVPSPSESHSRLPGTLPLVILLNRQFRIRLAHKQHEPAASPPGTWHNEYPNRADSASPQKQIRAHQLHPFDPMRFPWMCRHLAAVGSPHGTCGVTS
ncbi:hypothetical protein B0H19DRAFT_1146354 [Mycena capillaripes]|nr:hypothetical protein B0H19DRAFT_1146354 [Mycena capillaripes]